jgi:hypothetical protein
MTARIRSGSFKSRELRRRVMLPARVLDGAGWSNACILNISSRGMLLHAKSAAPKGSCIELTHGHYVITARVVWRSGAKLGLAAEARLPIEDLAAYAAVPPPAVAVEFACVAMFGASLAIAAFGMVQRALAEPLKLVQAALGG